MSQLAAFKQSHLVLFHACLAILMQAFVPGVLLAYQELVTPGLYNITDVIRVSAVVFLSHLISALVDYAATDKSVQSSLPEIAAAAVVLQPTAHQATNEWLASADTVRTSTPPPPAVYMPTPRQG